MIGISSALIGCYIVKLNPLERILLFAAGLLMIDPGTLTDVLGFAVFAAITVVQYKRKKSQQVDITA